MITEKLYTYLGTNGTLTTPIHLDGVPALIQYRLIAENGKILTDGTNQVNTVTVYTDGLKKWKEIDL